jgi:hypothetical protein
MVPKMERSLAEHGGRRAHGVRRGQPVPRHAQRYRLCFRRLNIRMLALAISPAGPVALALRIKSCRSTIEPLQTGRPW